MCDTLLLVLMSPGHLVFMCLMSFLVHCTCVHETPFYVLSVLVLCLVFCVCHTRTVRFFCLGSLFLLMWIKYSLPGLQRRVSYTACFSPRRGVHCVFFVLVYVNFMQGCVLTAHHHLPNFMCVPIIYASPSSREAYRDRQLTTNFEFWVEIFCVPTCFHIRIPKPCLSVRTPRK